MSEGLLIKTEIIGLENLQRKLRRLSFDDMTALLENIGGLIESQTRQRISTEKKAPDGTAWKPWSAAYAATRHSGHSLLVNEGDLRDSIQYQVEGDQVSIGSNLVYAGVQHDARPFMGLSDENQDELWEEIDRWLREDLR